MKPNLWQKRVLAEIRKLSAADRKRLEKLYSKENPTGKDVEFLKGKTPLYLGSENNGTDFGGWFEYAQAVYRGPWKQS